MRVDDFFQNLESQLQSWTAGLWQGDPLPRLREEARRLQREVRQRSDVLARHRSGLEGLRQRIAAAEERAALLTEWVETYLRVADQPNAWRFALELDHLRRELSQDCGRLEGSERIYRESAADLKHVQERLADLCRQIDPRAG